MIEELDPEQVSRVEWRAVLAGDVVLGTAIFDRLLHHAITGLRARPEIRSWRTFARARKA